MLNHILLYIDSVQLFLAFPETMIPQTYLINFVLSRCFNVLFFIVLKRFVGECCSCRGMGAHLPPLVSASRIQLQTGKLTDISGCRNHESTEDGCFV